MENQKKKNKGTIATIVILSILVIALSCYIGYDVFLSKHNVSTNTIEENSKNKTSTEDEVKYIEDNENSKESQTIESNEDSSKKEKCYGTYHINNDATQGIYTLREDGTYQVENQENSGVFTINENTITFIEKKHTTGPREEDPIFYNPKSYLISDDCSKIRLTDSGSHVSAFLIKVN